MKLAKKILGRRPSSHRPREGSEDPDAVKAEEQKQRALEEKAHLQERANLNAPFM